MANQISEEMGPKWNEFAYGDYHEIVAWELRYLVRRYAEYWETIMYKKPSERLQYRGEVEIRRISVVVFTCVLLESAINFYLCTKCRTKEFIDIEHRGLSRKWSREITRFVPKYSLTEELEMDLRELTERRNLIVHSKPTMSFDGDNRHRGNEPTYVLDEHDFMRRCSSLPWRLVENLLRFDFHAFPELSGIRILCGEVQREFAYGDYWIGEMERASEELIVEIISQGYSREVAHRYAVYIDDRPHRDADGNIFVKRGRQLIAKLKPLKYFSSDGPGAETRI